MKFSIREGNSLDYEQVKTDYCNGIIGKKLQKKYGIGSSQYTSLLKRFREDGIKVNGQGSISPIKKPRFYQKQLSKGIMYFTVTRTINGIRYYGGMFHTEAEAQQSVKELNEIGWESCLCSQ